MTLDIRVGPEWANHQISSWWPIFIMEYIIQNQNCKMHLTPILQLNGQFCRFLGTKMVKNDKFPLVISFGLFFNSIQLSLLQGEVSITISIVGEIMARWHFSVRENPTFISITRISYFLLLLSLNNKICGCNKITTFICLCLIAWSVHKL